MQEDRTNSKAGSITLNFIRLRRFRQHKDRCSSRASCSCWEADEYSADHTNGTFLQVKSSQSSKRFAQCSTALYKISDVIIKAYKGCDTCEISRSRPMLDSISLFELNLEISSHTVFTYPKSESKILNIVCIQLSLRRFSMKTMLVKKLQNLSRTNQVFIRGLTEDKNVIQVYVRIYIDKNKVILVWMLLMSTWKVAGASIKPELQPLNWDIPRGVLNLL